MPLLVGFFPNQDSLQGNSESHIRPFVVFTRKGTHPVPGNTRIIGMTYVLIRTHELILSAITYLPG